MKSKDPQPSSNTDELDFRVTIHFKENSIPGLRRGELTEESKQEIMAWHQRQLKAFAEEVREEAVLATWMSIQPIKGKAVPVADLDKIMERHGLR